MFKNISACMCVVSLMMIAAISVGSEMGPAEGVISYYADSLHGNVTASGEKYDKNKMTAAHKSLAFGTRVRVTNLDNGNSVVVVVNDRGPFVEGRILDVSRHAADQLDMGERGLVNARIALE